MDPCCATNYQSPATSFCDETLAEFEACLDERLDPDDRGQKPYRPFVNGLSAVAASLEVDPVLLEIDTAKLPSGRVKRSEVLALAADREVTVATACVAAMAWGGMHLGNWNTLCRTSDGKWLEVAQCIRDGKLTRAEAYERLGALRAQGTLKGMGPAFFTKLIYFLAPRESERKSAYIMDQWVGSSVNLLTSSELVLFDVTRKWKSVAKGQPEPSRDFTASDENTVDRYEAFCSVLDQLSYRFGLGVDQIDRALSSGGGTNSARWRKHVVAHRPRLLK